MDQKIDQFILDFKEKNYEKFDEFYELTYRKVYYAIIAIVRDEAVTADLLQDTYMNFLNKIEQYKMGSNVYAYLSTIGRNLSYNHYNKFKKEIHSDKCFETLKSEDIVTKDNEIDILELLEDLTQIEREIVVLHVINNFKFREIAEVTKKPLGTILWIYRKAIKHLKVKVGEINESQRT